VLAYVANQGLWRNRGGERVCRAYIEKAKFRKRDFLNDPGSPKPTSLKESKETTPMFWRYLLYSEFFILRGLETIRQFKSLDRAGWGFCQSINNSKRRETEIILGA
jgi:hypothetical protein